MSKRMINFHLGISSLFIGGLLYLLVRERTYISIAIRQAFSFVPFDSVSFDFSCNFIKFYLPDFLWAFSLSCLLRTFCASSTKGVLICCCIAFLCGSAWEFMQKVNIISGTGDLLDVIMYLLGAILCLLINLKERKV